MAFYRLPKIIGKDNKPPFGTRINWHHPLSQGLVGAWLFNEEGGTNNYNLLKTPLQSDGFTWVDDGAYYNGTQYSYGINTPPIGDMSVGFILNTSLTGGLMYYANGKLDQDVWDRSIYIGNFGRILCRWWDSLHSNEWLSSISSITDGTQKNVVVTNTATAPGKKIYIDGKLDAADANAYGYSGYNGYTTPYVHLGVAFSGSLQYFNGTMKAFFIWARALSDAEVASLYANPYQMFWHPMKDIYYAPAAAPPPTGGRSIFGYDNIFHSGGIIQI